MPWVADAKFGAGGVTNPVRRATAPTAGIGELRNPNFPDEVVADPPAAWTGTIDAFNTGTETHTFRFRDDITGLRESFDLGPGGTYTDEWSGAGPKEFWIYLDRWVAEAPKLPWHLIGAAAAASACVIGLAVVAVKA